MENGQRLSTVTWRKSSYSGPVRDSKYPEAGRFAVAPQA